ncbi:hypothetical protein AO372_0317 [Moraxella catarrhalis]|nr:hypothetical protein AO374_1952 [Moraxella catarrhalis]OAV16120.1 hypothetical protein AO376_0118 [Moraxella catarrhalis]OAV22011.1 hypothetical protein AO372_0317 [Moraxella catarrhalis]
MSGMMNLSKQILALKNHLGTQSNQQFIKTVQMTSWVD